MFSQSRTRTLFLVTSVLIILMAGRILHLGVAIQEFHADEVWSVWQLIGSHTDYTRDANWPPLYYMMLDGWWRVAGLQPIALRMLSLFIFLIGEVCLYRAIRRIRTESAALLAVLAFGGLALNVYLTTQVRPYALVYGLLPISLWLTMRYFDHPRLGRGLVLGAVLAAMFYAAYGSVGAFLLLGIYTLVVYRQAIWRWWLPGVSAVVIAAPVIVSIFSLATGRVKAVTATTLPPLPTVLANLFRWDTGNYILLWLLLLIIATILVFYRQRLSRSSGLLAWTLSPILIYILNPVLGLLASPMYTWFVTIGFAAWIGVGLSYLPRIGKIMAAVALIVVIFTPLTAGEIGNIAAQNLPLSESFQWLAQHVQWGDVIVLDPKWKDRYCDCIRAEMIEYFTNLYFPQGLRVVDNPDGYRRVWYLKWASQEDKAFEQRVQTNRVPGIFVGPPEALFRLYEAPPDSAGIPFANGMRFHGIDVLDQPTNLLVRRAGDKFRVRLWWSVDKPVDADYSVALHIYANNQLSVQSDSAPQIAAPDIPHETSRWQSGQFYIEERELEVPKSFTSGDYPLYLIVYQWQNNTRVAAPGVNQDGLLPIYTLTVKSF